MENKNWMEEMEILKPRWERAKLNKSMIKLAIPIAIIPVIFGLFYGNIKMFALGIMLWCILEATSMIILSSCLITVKEISAELFFINGAIIITFMRYIFTVNQTIKNHYNVCQFIFIVISFYMRWHCKRKTDLRLAEIQRKEEQYFRKEYGDYWYKKHKMDQQIYGQCWMK